MKIENFINSVKEGFGFKLDTDDGKKKSLKLLLEKLKEKRKKLEKKINKKKNKPYKKEMKLDLEIIDLQIKKCKTVLDKLDN